MPDLAAPMGPRLVLLTNIIPPYHKPLLDRLARVYPAMRILLSTSMESNRSWNLEWSGLNVSVQKTITLNRRWRHPKGFSEPLYLHLPVDTLSQLSRLRPDLVISWEMGVRTMFAVVYRLLHRRSKLIVWAEIAEATERGRGLLRNAIRRFLHRGVDGFLVTGESGARYLQSLGVPEGKLTRIAYTTDVSRFASEPLIRPAACAWRLLYVGQLIPRKGLLPFLDALAKWAAAHPHSSVEFTLAGEGPLRETLERFTPPANLHIALLGNVAYSDLPAVYSQAGIFVFPTFADTWGVVVNEAMAAGLPVLGSVYGQAVSELVRDRETGWTFRPDVGDEMLDALDRSLNTPAADLDRMRRLARNTALELSPEYLAGIIDRAITSCIAH